MANIVLKNPGRVLEFTSNTATASATKSTKAALSCLPEVITFYRTGKGLYLGKIESFMLYKWNKKVIDFIQVQH